MIGGWAHRRLSFVRHLLLIPKRTVAGLMLAHLLNALASPITSVAIGFLVAEAVAADSASPLGDLLVPLAVIGGVLLYSMTAPVLLVPVRSRVAQLIDESVMTRVRRALAAPAGIAHLESQEYRDLMSMPTSGYASIGQALEAQLQLVARYAGAAISTVLVSVVSPVAAAVSLGLRLVKRFYLRRLYAPALADSGRALAPHMREMEWWSTVGASPTAAKDVRVFSMVERTVERLHDSARAPARLYSSTFRRTALLAWPAWILELMAMALPAWLLANRALGGDASLQSLVTALTALVGIGSIGGVGNETYQVEAALSNVEALDELERRAAAAGDNKAGIEPRREAAPPHIRFEAVAFAYPGTDRLVLRDLDLTLEPRQSVAIVGENGVGKSTILKLLGRIYGPTSGRITADGVDIATIDPVVWRRRLAIVNQEFVKVELSVRQNVALADWDHPQADRLVEEALDAAGAAELVTELPNGLDTVLSPQYAGGTDLSGGQWQRIVLARALYAASTGANVLVLDEPTAHLDVDAEVALFDQLLDRAADATTIVVSHRYSTVRRAERIVVLSDRGITETGSHDDLMARDGTYARLFRLQASAFASDVEDPAG